MPQSTTQSPQVDPKVGQVGDDPLRPFLDPLQVDNSIKRQAWDNWHAASTPSDFKQRFDSLDIPRETKRALWNLKFTPPIDTLEGAKAAIAQSHPESVDTQNQAATIASLKQYVQGPLPKGDHRPSAPEVYGNQTARKALDWAANELYPSALAATNKVLTTPVGKWAGVKTLSERYADSDLAKTPAGLSATDDSIKLAARTAAGIGDFIQSPAGMAATFLTAVTAGAYGPAAAATMAPIAPYVAGGAAAGFAAGQVPDAKEAIKTAYKNPSPDNVQEALYQTAMIPAILAGGKHEGKPVIGSESIIKPGGAPKQGFKGGAYDSTPMGPRDSGELQPLQIQTVTQAPPEVKAPQTISAKSHDPSLFSQDGRPGRGIGVSDEDRMALAKAQAAITGKVTLALSDKGELLPPKEERPQITYKPSEKAETLSEPSAVERLGPEFAQEQVKHEIDRNNSILSNPNATPEERKVARQRLIEGLPLTPTAETKGPITGGTVAEDPHDLISKAINNFQDIANLSRRMDLAENDSHHADLSGQRQRLVDETQTIIDRALQTLKASGKTDALEAIQKVFSEQADKLNLQANDIRE